MQTVIEKLREKEILGYQVESNELGIKVDLTFDEPYIKLSDAEGICKELYTKEQVVELLRKALIMEIDTDYLDRMIVLLLAEVK